ncbi:MAG: glycosyltransferase family 4 protein [Bacteroidales bacterium]
MKKVLVITYYWPPAGGAGVQRWLKFVKYLRNYGWEPVVYTPENPEYPVLDNSLENDIPEGVQVIRKPVFEPYDLYKKFTGRRKEDTIKSGFLSEEKKPGLTESIAVWIRGNWFIPDARKFWIAPSVRFLTGWLNENRVNAIVSTGPPHSMHLIAQRVAAATNLPWLADFRDPWTSIDFYHQLKLTCRSDRKHHRLELSVLQSADRVVVISNGMAEDFRRIFDRQYDVITNGFDEDDLPQAEAVTDTEKFVILHAGSLVPARNPLVFWQALKQLRDEAPEVSESLTVELAGQVDYSVKQAITEAGLSDMVRFHGYLPHDEVTRLQQQAHLLLLVVNRTPNARMVVTGKLFEYLASGTPVLGIGPAEGDAADILNETQAGMMCDWDDVEAVKSEIMNWFESWRQKSYRKNPVHLAAKYSRKKLTGHLARILDEIGG